MTASERTAVLVLAQKVRACMDNLQGSSDSREMRLYQDLSDSLRDVCVVCKLGSMDPPW